MYQGSVYSRILVITEKIIYACKLFYGIIQYINNKKFICFLQTTHIKYINIRPDTIKFLDENIGIILFDINHSNVFLDLSPIVMDIKAKTSKYKLKSLFTERKL